MVPERAWFAAYHSARMMVQFTHYQSPMVTACWTLTCALTWTAQITPCPALYCVLSQSLACRLQTTLYRRLSPALKRTL